MKHHRTDQCRRPRGQRLPPSVLELARSSLDTLCTCVGAKTGLIKRVTKREVPDTHELVRWVWPSAQRNTLLAITET